MKLNLSPQPVPPSDAPFPANPPKKRADIINILGLLLIIDSTLMILMRIPDVIRSNSLFGPHPTPRHVYDTISMVLLFFSSFALLMRKRWARILILCLMILSLAEGVFHFVFYSFILDGLNQAGNGDSVLTWRSYQILAGCLTYTFFIAMLLTKKVAVQFGPRTDEQRPEFSNIWQVMKTLPRRTGAVNYRKIAIWAGSILVLGLGVLFILSVDRAPRARSVNATRTVWTGMGNLGRTSSVTGRGVHKPDSLLWKNMLWHKTGTYLLAAGDLLYFTNNQRLYALDASTGAVRWVFTGNPVSSNPLLIDDAVFVGTDIGALYAIDATTGQEKWRYQTGKSPFKLNMTPIGTAPITDGSAIYFGNALGYLYAVDLESKKELWKFKTGGSIVSSPSIDSDTIYFGSGDKNLYAVRLLDGKKKWTYNAKRPVYSTPVVSGDQVIFRNEDGTVIALDCRSGEEQWTFPAPSTNRSSPAVVDEIAYVGDNNGLFSALDLVSGTLQWQFTASGAISGTPVVADGIVYFGSDDRTLYALDAVTGTERWRYRAEAPVEAPPAIRDFAVIFSDVNGGLYALAEKHEAPGK